MRYRRRLWVQGFSLLADARMALDEALYAVEAGGVEEVVAGTLRIAPHAFGCLASFEYVERIPEVPERDDPPLTMSEV